MNRLPPTLRVRETVVFDQNKEVPDEIKAFDQAKKNKKKRYETRYKLEEEYRDLGVKQQDVAEQKALNRYHGEKYFEEKLKGFDNITLENTKEALKVCSQHAVHKPKLGIWEQLNQNSENPADPSLSSPKAQLKPDYTEKVYDVHKLPQYRRDEPEVAEPAPVPTPELRSEVVSECKQPSSLASNQNLAQTKYTAQKEENVVSAKPTWEARLKKSETESRLYNPELERDQRVYRNNEEQPRRPDVSLGSSNTSRLTSGLSNTSKLSFGSRKAQPNGPLVLPNLYAPAPVCGDMRRKGSSVKSIAVSRPSIQSGGFN
jgi:hypothetical protein